MTAVIASADEIDDFLAGPYTGGLPRALQLLAGLDAEHELCLEQLADFQGEVSACQDIVDDLQAEIATLQDQLDDCEGLSFPGDGVTGLSLSFEDTGKTILDKRTHLEWAKKTTDGGDHDWTKTYSYAQALNWIAALNASEYEGGGWRLPTIKELMSFADLSGRPVTPDVFGTMSAGAESRFWTQSPWPASPSSKYWFDVYNGAVNVAAAFGLLHVIAVR
jgi:hypothetical protein